MIRCDALTGKRILVVEDEAFFALYLADTIQEAGGAVVGPFASVAESLDALDAPGARIDAASLDIRLRDELCFPVADRLAALGTPFIFVSGTVDERPAVHEERPALQKPVAAYQIVEALEAITSELAAYLAPLSSSGMM